MSVSVSAVQFSWVGGLIIWRRAMKGEKRSGRGVANVTAAQLKSDPAAGEQNIFVGRLVAVRRLKGNESSNCFYMAFSYIIDPVDSGL